MCVFTCGVYGVLYGSYVCIASCELSSHSVSSGNCMCHGEGVVCRGVAGEVVVGEGTFFCVLGDSRMPNPAAGSLSFARFP